MILKRIMYYFTKSSLDRYHSLYSPTVFIPSIRGLVGKVFYQYFRMSFQFRDRTVTFNLLRQSPCSFTVGKFLSGGLTVLRQDLLVSRHETLFLRSLHVRLQQTCVVLKRRYRKFSTRPDVYLLQESDQRYHHYRSHFFSPHSSSLQIGSTVL